MKELRCPKCGNNAVLYEEEWRSEEQDEWTFHTYWRGHCLNCKTLLKWEEEYTFNRYCRIEIDE